MGGAIRDQSGYEGAWTPGRDTIFNNELYQVIANNAHKFHNKVGRYIDQFQTFDVI